MANSKTDSANKHLPNHLIANYCNQIIQKINNKFFARTKDLIKFGINSNNALEIGLGPECLGLEWLKNTNNTNLTGLEISAELVKIAENNASKYGLLNDRAKFLAYLTKTLPFEDNSFEAVFSNSSIHEWGEPVFMFNEIYRVLKPGGRYYISDFRRDTSFATKFYQAIINPQLIQNAAFSEKELNHILSRTKLCGSKISSTPSRLIISGIKPKIISIKTPILAIGISMKTSTKWASMDIAQLNQRYQKQNITAQIPNKKSPGTIIALSKNFHPVKKTFFYTLGEEVTTLAEIPPGLIGFEIPPINYVVFSVRPNGPTDVPRAIMEMKQYISECWFPNSNYQRAKIIDEFELYDERSKSVENPEINIYVAIK